MKLSAILVAYSLVAAPAFAQDMNMQGGTDMSGSPADQANMQAMQKMQNDMPKKGSGNPDRDFVMMMIPHHQGAIDMAHVEIQYGKDPKLKRMAAKIVKDQEKEIREMKDWLSKHK
jgi:uncharacterized protein (DUF305 family)